MKTNTAMYKGSTYQWWLEQKGHNDPGTLACILSLGGTFVKWKRIIWPTLVEAIWAGMQENLYSGVCEQQRHRPACASTCLISAFVNRLLESIIYRIVRSRISFFWLVSVAEQVGLNFTLSGMPKKDFLASQPI